MADVIPQRQQLLFTIGEAAADLGVSASLLQRAASHGRISVVYMGDRPMVSLVEKQRIAREGLTNIPPGYKRKTAGPARGGRPPKVAKPAPKPVAPRRKRGEAERRAAP